jgi:TetR/AcrR family transcriptional regulator, ethionamide resistance regulator
MVAFPSARRGARSRRPARPSGDDRETAILATCEKLLAERPLSAISVDDLARGAGISRPSFYFYFRSKDAVLLSLLDRVIAEADRASAEAFAARTGDRRLDWRNGIRAYFDTFRTHRGVTLAAAEARTTNDEVRRLWAGGFEQWVDQCAEVIDTERSRGAAPPGPPARDLAIALNSMNERALHGTFAGDGPAIAEEEVVDVLLDVWLTAIYHTPNPPGSRPVAVAGS